MKPGSILLLLLLSEACLGHDLPAASEGPSSADAVPAANGRIVVEECRGLSGVDETCVLVTRGDDCRDQRCDRLVVIFSGGEMGCESGTGYEGAMQAYASAGYAAVCINYFETAEGSGARPYVDEASRIDRALREATTGAWAQAHWTGAELLLEGVSHGATAPMVLMARTRLDEQPHWKGSRKTGACFFDGIYDIPALEALLATGGIGGRPCSLPVSYDRLLERYCGAGATPASCDLEAATAAAADSITEVDPAAFSVTAFKLFECGSGLRACTGDIVPGAPIERLCRSIDAGPNHSCVFVSLPSDGHLTCHADQFDECRQWFETLSP